MADETATTSDWVSRVLVPADSTGDTWPEPFDVLRVACGLFDYVAVDRAAARRDGARLIADLKRLRASKKRLDQVKKDVADAFFIMVYVGEESEPVIAFLAQRGQHLFVNYAASASAMVRKLAKALRCRVEKDL